MIQLLLFLFQETHDLALKINAVRHISLTRGKPIEQTWSVSKELNLKTKMIIKRGLIYRFELVLSKRFYRLVGAGYTLQETKSDSKNKSVFRGNKKNWKF